MNISTENRMIWLAPERCATQITKKILSNYDFTFAVPCEQDKNSNFLERRHFHSNIIDEPYKDFQTILNVRNPYDIVFSFYVNNYISKPLTIDSKNVKENFNNWILKVFLNHGYYVFLCPIYNNDDSQFNKWKFDDDKQPDYVLRVESLFDDIIKIPFIFDNPKTNKEHIKNIIQDNGYLNKRYHIFDQLYDFKSAQLVYHFFKPYFYKFGYSPYSFTRESLLEDDKIRFIHGYID